VIALLIIRVFSFDDRGAVLESIRKNFQVEG
jgi:hypothetical protein